MLNIETSAERLKKAREDSISSEVVSSRSFVHFEKFPLCEYRNTSWLVTGCQLKASLAVPALSQARA